MIESRCGLLCSECEYKVQMNCGGCVHIKKPFWGESCRLRPVVNQKKRNTAATAVNFPVIY